MSNGVPPLMPPTAPPKKGLSPWAWVAIGCSGIVVVLVVVAWAAGFFVLKKGKEMVEEATGSESFQEIAQNLKNNPTKAVAELMIRANPELDLISTDDEEGTITFRNTRTAKEATLHFEDVAEGRFSMTTSEGDYSIDATEGEETGVTFKGPEGETHFGASADLSNVPDWVPAYPDATDTRSLMHSFNADGIVGALSSKTSDNAQKVVDHFKMLFEDQGYKIGSVSMTKTGDGAFGAITGELSGQGRSINVVIIESSGKSQFTINYNEKKQ